MPNLDEDVLLNPIYLPYFDSRLLWRIEHFRIKTTYGGIGILDSTEFALEWVFL